MSYTALRVDEAGVVLFAHHARRLAPEGGALRDAFAAFARDAAPGAYTVTSSGGRLVATVRGPSRLVDGMPVRSIVSPFAGQAGLFAKPAPPSPYDAVRISGVATLLTSADGRELYESCSAALVGWNGTALVLAPSDRPRVASVAESALRAAEHVEAPLLAAQTTPLALVNAVKGLCRIAAPGREPFPAAAAELIERLLRGSTSRG